MIEFKLYPPRLQRNCKVSMKRQIAKIADLRDIVKSEGGSVVWKGRTLSAGKPVHWSIKLSDWTLKDVLCIVRELEIKGDVYIAKQYRS